MTKEITKAFIIQQIQDKFNLREFEPSKFLFDETVVPTYNIEPHLQRYLVKYKSVSISAGPSAYLYFTVPQNEKWWLRGYNIIFETGSYTVTGLYIHRGADIYYMYLDMELGQSASYIVNLPTPVALEAGDRISIYVDGYTSTGNLQLRADVMVEEAR